VKRIDKMIRKNTMMIMGKWVGVGEKKK